jgi:hypothetical protein
MDNSYWLERVISKLNTSFMSGTVMGEWAPDQENPEAESRALDVLEIAEVIKSPGGFMGAPAKYQYRIVDIKEGFARSNPNRRITSFNYDKFIQFCNVNGFNPTVTGVLAQLKIEDEVQPIITIDNIRHALKAMPAGRLPQRIIAYAWKNPDKRISLDELRENIAMVELKRDDATITQILDKKNIFGKNGALSAFAEIDTRSILLKQETRLAPDKVVAIKKSSTN